MECCVCHVVSRSFRNTVILIVFIFVAIAYQHYLPYLTPSLLAVLVLYYPSSTRYPPPSLTRVPPLAMKRALRRNFIRDV